jgi:probable RNA-binding protein EIF1AD
LHDLPVPDFDGGERIAKVHSTRGGNQFDVIVADPPSSLTLSKEDSSNRIISDRSPHLALLPNRFHKVVWIKRNDFVIVRGGAQDTGELSKSEGSCGIRYIITHVLYKDQIKHLKKENLWPVYDVLFSEVSPVAYEQATSISLRDGDGIEYSGDENSSEAETQPNEWDDYLVNTNRLAKIRIRDSSDEESLDDE